MIFCIFLYLQILSFPSCLHLLTSFHLIWSFFYKNFLQYDNQNLLFGITKLRQNVVVRFYISINYLVSYKTKFRFINENYKLKIPAIAHLNFFFSRIQWRKHPCYRKLFTQKQIKQIISKASTKKKETKVEKRTFLWISWYTNSSKSNNF